jgi:hypothetical protein
VIADKPSNNKVVVDWNAKYPNLAKFRIPDAILPLIIFNEHFTLRFTHFMVTFDTAAYLYAKHVEHHTNADGVLKYGLKFMKQRQNMLLSIDALKTEATRFGMNDEDFTQHFRKVISVVDAWTLNIVHLNSPRA